MTLEKNKNAYIATEKQIETVREYAINLWGKNWKAKLCDEYEKKNGYAHRTKNSKVRAWLNGDYLPNLTSFNELLIAIDCEMKIITNPKEIL